MVSGDVLNMTLYMEAKLMPNTISRNTVAELVGTSQPDKVSKFIFVRILFTKFESETETNKYCRCFDFQAL